MSRILHHQRYSLAHEDLLQAIANSPRFLIIQDLDGVCMGLVRDPKVRELDREYIHACKALSNRFFVLTNGEHVGTRGVNLLVEQAFDSVPEGYVEQQGLYLPGLAAGGVQFQDCYGALMHPGVSDRELEFLERVPEIMADQLGNLLGSPPYQLTPSDVSQILDTIVLDNAVSPTVNIGSLYDHFADDRAGYVQLQQKTMQLMSLLMQEAERCGLSDSFFIHLAPNLGSQNDIEQLKPASDTDMGTTDFQFMLRGAVKEVGVLVLLNHYYFIETGEYPLGEHFNARNAPKNRDGLLALAERAFDPAIMPRIIGVGDTVTSTSGNLRGGSDRGFLTLVQDLGQRFQSDNAVLFIDSSRGALKRPGIEPLPQPGDTQVPLSSLQGISDSEDPLKINFVFPGGHKEYTKFFIALSQRC